MAIPRQQACMELDACTKFGWELVLEFDWFEQAVRTVVCDSQSNIRCTREEMIFQTT